MDSEMSSLVASKLYRAYNCSRRNEKGKAADLPEISMFSGLGQARYGLRPPPTGPQLESKFKILK